MIRRLLALLLAAAFGAAPAAFGQAFPSKQIQVVLSFPPGSATDLATRIVAEKLRERLGQPVVVENRSGAGAVLGETYIAKAPADGHFIAIGSSTSLAVAPNTRLRLEYDVRRDFIPLSLLCEVPQWIVANPALPASNLAELAALVKAQPGKFSYASYGQGTLSHLGMELWKSMAGIEMLHVPYKGGPQAHPDVMSGRVPVLWDSVSSALSAVRSGKLKALAITGPERLAEIPEVPTVAESGFPGYEVTGFLVAIVPAATPRPVADRLGAELALIMKMSDVRARMTAGGLLPKGSSAEDARARISAYLDKFAQAVKIAGYQPE